MGIMIALGLFLFLQEQIKDIIITRGRRHNTHTRTRTHSQNVAGTRVIGPELGHAQPAALVTLAVLLTSSARAASVSFGLWGQLGRDLDSRAGASLVARGTDDIST